MRSSMKKLKATQAGLERKINNKLFDENENKNENIKNIEIVSLAKLLVKQLTTNSKIKLLVTKASSISISVLWFSHLVSVLARLV